jgi:hypothetical protein
MFPSIAAFPSENEDLGAGKVVPGYGFALRSRSNAVDMRLLRPGRLSGDDEWQRNDCCK